MRSKAFYIAFAVLFVLFSINAYACLFSMSPSSTMMSMPMDGSMPSNDENPMPCKTIQCDAAAPKDKTENDCQISSAASSLTALKLTAQNTPIPVLNMVFITKETLYPVPDRRTDDAPRPYYSVSLLLLHSTLLL